MDDLISRKALLDAYDKAHQGPPGGARKLIEEAQDALIRCKDCKQSGIDSTSYPQYWCSAHSEYHDAEWFCADGER